jgi:hypothetical protein
MVFRVVKKGEIQKLSLMIVSNKSEKARTCSFEWLKVTVRLEKDF